MFKATIRLLFICLGLVVDNREVSHLVGVLVAGDHVQVVAELLLLEVLLRQVLEVALGERCLRCHGDTRLGHGSGNGSDDRQPMGGGPR